jgi:hypothetical protein
VGRRRPRAFPSAQWIGHCQRLIELEARFPAVQRGDEEPSNATEKAEFAWFAAKFKQLNSLATRWYGEAFDAKPHLAENLQTALRYGAACTAARAASGRGQDADKISYTEQARSRQQCLTWLRADLDLWAKQLEDKRAGAAAARLTLQQWQRELDLASLREDVALGNLPVAEKGAWRKLWADVAALLKQARELEKRTDSKKP